MKIPRPIVKRMLDVCTAFQNGPSSASSDARGLGRFLTDALGIEDRGPDFEGMLGEVLDAVQTQGGRLGCALATREGVDAALVALSELAPVLAPSPGDTQALTQMLREAVRVQPLTVRVLFLLNIGSVDVRGKIRSSSEEVLRIVEQHILPVLPPERSRLELVDGAWGEVMGFRFSGNACTVLLRCHRRGQAVPVAKA